MTTELDRTADAFATIASRAGRVILDVYATDFDVRAKADDSPVTAADEAAEMVILSALRALLPGVPIVAEEAVARGDVPTLDGRDFLLVDPLDGTREFLARTGEFTVNIALVSGGRPTVGVVYAPVSGTIYLGGDTARRGAVVAGARFLPADAETIHARPRPIGGLVAVASKTHGCERTKAYLAGLRITQCVAIGSASKFGLIAAGEADVYPRFTPTSEWDTAAGHAVLSAAGGAVLTPEGAPLPYGRRAAGFVNGPFIAWGRAP